MEEYEKGEEEDEEDESFKYLEDRLLERERIIHYHLDEERIFRLLIKAAKKRCKQQLLEQTINSVIRYYDEELGEISDSDVSVSNEDFLLLLYQGEGTLININTEVNDNCYLQRVELQGYTFRTLTTIFAPYRPSVRVKEEEPSYCI